MDFFVWHPERVAIVGAAFALTALVLAVFARSNPRVRSRPMFAAAALWLLYALWEGLALQKRWNIRVDLFLIYPVLFVASVAAPLLSVRWRKPEKSV